MQRTRYVYGFGDLVATTDEPDFPPSKGVREQLDLQPLPVSVAPLQTLPPLSIEILGCLSHNPNTSGVYNVKVMLDNTPKLAILKLYHLDREPEFEAFPAEESDTSEEFQKETAAYAQLIHYGLPAKRMVPHCYGIIDIPEWPSPQLTGKVIEHHFENDHGPPKAILLEHLDDMRELDSQNLSEPVAEKALGILTSIHEAYVIHNDCAGRNIMASDDGRVMMIDFGKADVHPQSTGDYDGVIANHMQGEYKLLWAYLYQTYLPGLKQMNEGHIPTDPWAREFFMQERSDSEFISDED